MTFELLEQDVPRAKIRIIGIGGGGGNAINTMIEQGLTGVEFVAINTDTQDLERSMTANRIQLNTAVGYDKDARGLGTGGDPEIGREVALENREMIRSILEGTDMVFLTAGMGGGTGTGVTPIIAELAREMGVLTVAIVTRPFFFEGRRRRSTAEEGIQVLKSCVDTLITISNQRLLSAYPNIQLKQAFHAVDNVLYQAVRGVSDLINISGFVNVDFADVHSIMANKGLGLMGVGIAGGDRAVLEAAEQAVTSPLLNDTSMTGARNILINIRGSEGLSIHAIDEANRAITEAADPDANVIIGLIEDPTMGDTVQVTVIATDFEHDDRTVQRDVEVRVVGESIPQSGINTQTDMNQNTSPFPKKAPLVSNTSGGFSMDEFHLPSLRRRRR